jgi:TonB family protein
MKGRVERLRNELQIPQPIQQELQKADTTAQIVYDCEELEISLEMQESPEVFADSIAYPESLQGMTLSGEVNLRVTIDETGQVIEATTTSRSSNLGLEEAVIDALRSRGKFKPVIHPEKGTPISVQCEYSLPIRLNASR